MHIHRRPSRRHAGFWKEAQYESHTAVLLSWRASALNGTLQPLSRSRAWIVALTTRDYMQVLYISNTLWGPFIIWLEKKKVCLQVNKSTWVYKSLLGKNKKHTAHKSTHLSPGFSLSACMDLNDVCHLAWHWHVAAVWLALVVKFQTLTQQTLDNSYCDYVYIYVIYMYICANFQLFLPCIQMSACSKVSLYLYGNSTMWCRERKMKVKSIIASKWNILSL